MEAKLLYRPFSLWVGAHLAKCFADPAYKWQLCINLIPCVTIRVRFWRYT